MGADLDAMLLGQSHGLAHMVEVGAMESAGDVGHVDQRHQAFVAAHLVEAEGFPHVAVDVDHLSFSSRQPYLSSIRIQRDKERRRRHAAAASSAYFDTR